MDVTIEAAGMKIETTSEAIKAAADNLSSVRFAKDQLK
jgi:hypothetical protein